MAKVRAGTAIIITGVKEIDDKLHKFEGKVQKKALRKATRAAAKFVRDDAKALAPHDTGQLEASIKVKAIKRQRGKIGHAVMTGEGLFKGETFYGGFVELGTQRMRADPYLRPALYGNEKETLARFRVEMKKAIDEL